MKRAQILLKADLDGPAWTDAKIAEVFDCRVQTVEKLRQRLVAQGFATALERQPRTTPPTPPKLDGAAEAKLIALVCDNLKLASCLTVCQIAYHCPSKPSDKPWAQKSVVRCGYWGHWPAVVGTVGLGQRSGLARRSI